MRLICEVASFSASSATKEASTRSVVAATRVDSTREPCAISSIESMRARASGCEERGTCKRSYIHASTYVHACMQVHTCCSLRAARRDGSVLRSVPRPTRSPATDAVDAQCSSIFGTTINRWRRAFRNVGVKVAANDRSFSRAINPRDSKVSHFRFKYHGRSRARRLASLTIARDDTVGTLALTLLITLMHREPWQSAAIVTPRRRFTTGHRGVKCRENNDARSKQRWQRGHTRGITVIICCRPVFKVAPSLRSLLSFEFPFSLSRSHSVTRMTARVDDSIIESARCSIHTRRLCWRTAANFSANAGSIDLSICTTVQIPRARENQSNYTAETVMLIEGKKQLADDRNWRTNDTKHFANRDSLERRESADVHSIDRLLARSYRRALRVHMKCACRRDRAPMYSARVPCSMARQHAESRGPSRTGRRDEAQPPTLWSTPLRSSLLFSRVNPPSSPRMPLDVLLSPDLDSALSHHCVSLGRRTHRALFADPSFFLSSFLVYLARARVDFHSRIHAIDRCESIARVSIYSQLAMCLRALCGNLSGGVSRMRSQWNPIRGIPNNPHRISIDFIDFSF